MRKWLGFGLLTLASLWLLTHSSVKADEKSPIGNKVENFSLQDYRGKTHSLSDWKNKKFVVVAFLGVECPLVKLYGPRLQSLADQYESKDVAFIGINSNVQDSITEIAAYARKHEIEFPILKDLKNQLADDMGATRTPEVFVLDRQRIVRYWGRIDDQYGVTYIRNEPKRHDLKVALDELLAGKQVSQPVTKSEGCFIGRIGKVNPDSTVTYSKHIAPILQKRCVECHRNGEIAPFALTKYDEVKGWSYTIEEVVREQRMPPWHASPKYGKFGNDRSLTKEEKQLIYKWVENGAPEGDPKHLPKPPTFATGWQFSREPDVVFNITDAPYRVPATGEVRYQYFRVPTNFKEDKWFETAQIMPGNRAVVHHILVFAIPPGVKSLREVRGGRSGFLAGYVPGRREVPYPTGFAKKIPAGSTLIFQVHYTPVGTVQFDQSKIGFYFADPKTVKYEVKTSSASNPFLRIPANADNHAVSSASKPLPKSLLLSFMPHMHLRGKSVHYEARYPDGKKEVLLQVPNYDFNWQTVYRLAKPKPLPEGTRIYALFHYDNSENNLNNPDPSKTVTWGDQTWEEMMIGYFEYAVSRDASKKSDPGKGLKTRLQLAKERAEQVMRQFDRNKDGKITRSEVPKRLLRTFDRMDINNDDQLTITELTVVFSLAPQD